MLGTGKITAFPKQQPILVGLVATPPAVLQDDLGVIAINNALDIRSTGVLIGSCLKECPYLVLVCFQMRRSAENFTDGVIVTEERKALVLIASVVVV